MMFFRYQRFLENEVSDLRKRVSDLESKNQELVLALFEKASITLPERPKPSVKHTISKTDTSARCSCGWTVAMHDPAELQQKISEHYRQGSVPFTRKNWPSLRQEVERQGETE